MLKKLVEEKQTFTPESGYNLVGEDDFEMVGDRLYLIAHYDTLEEAEAAKAEREAEMVAKGNDMDRLHIYGPKSPD